MKDLGQARAIILKRDVYGKETLVEAGPWVNVVRDFDHMVSHRTLERPRELAPDEIPASEWRPTPEAA